MSTAQDNRKLWNVDGIGSLQVKRLDLFASRVWDSTLPCNAGFEEARSLLGDASGSHPESVALHDASNWSEDQRRTFYKDRLKDTASLLHPSGMRWDYRLRTVLGTNSRRGCYTGGDVSVLVVEFVSPPVPLAAPHAKWKYEGQRTMLDVLRLLAPDQQHRLFGRLA